MAFVDSNCDGVDGVAADAVFVSAQTGADGAAGTRQKPLRLLSDAVALAAKTGRSSVLAATGTYPGILKVTPKVSVYGGYDPATWKRTKAAATTISGGYDVTGSSFGVKAVDVITATTLQLLTVKSPTPAATSGSAYGVHAVHSPSLRLDNLTAAAGNGREGKDGQIGADGLPGQNGAYGGSGKCDDPIAGAGGAGGGSPSGYFGGNGGNGGATGSGFAGAAGLVLGGAGGAGGAAGSTGTTAWTAPTDRTVRTGPPRRRRCSARSTGAGSSSLRTRRTAGTAARAPAEAAAVAAARRSARTSSTAAARAAAAEGAAVAEASAAAAARAAAPRSGSWPSTPPVSRSPALL